LPCFSIRKSEFAEFGPYVPIWD